MNEFELAIIYVGTIVVAIIGLGTIFVIWTAIQELCK